MHGPEVDRRIENLLQLGTIASVDYANARVRVKAGNLLTAPLPWITARAGAARSWWPPSVGEQVLLFSPGGDPARGIVLLGVYSTAHPAPAAGEQLHQASYPDGAVIAYDAATHALTATLPDGATAALTATGGVTITGDVTVNGKLHVTKDVDCDQTVTATTDCIGNGVSLHDHVHTGVTAGTATSGPPQ